jgi:hypothetical protein
MPKFTKSPGDYNREAAVCQDGSKKQAIFS